MAILSVAGNQNSLLACITLFDRRVTHTHTRTSSSFPSILPSFLHSCHISFNELRSFLPFIFIIFVFASAVSSVTKSTRQVGIHHPNPPKARALAFPTAILSFAAKPAWAAVRFVIARLPAGARTVVRRSQVCGVCINVLGHLLNITVTAKICLLPNRTMK